MFKITIVGIAAALIGTSASANIPNQTQRPLAIAGTEGVVILAQTNGQERRDDRQDNRGDRQDDRGERRDDRQDCRQEEGVAGKDKRDCKQDERQDGGEADSDG